MSRNNARLVVGITLTLIGIAGIFSPAIIPTFSGCNNVPANLVCDPMPNAFYYESGYIWLLGIALFALGLVLISNSKRSDSLPEGPNKLPRFTRAGCQQSVNPWNAIR